MCRKRQSSKSADFEQRSNSGMTRRSYLCLLGAAPHLVRAQQATGPSDNLDWVCPMHPEYRSAKPGKCPLCGMTLVLGIPDRTEFEMEVSHAPRVLKPGDLGTLDIRFFDARTHQPATRFEIVHEKLMDVLQIAAPKRSACEFCLWLSGDTEDEFDEPDLCGDIVL
jgi:hypothetical protein